MDSRERIDQGIEVLLQRGKHFQMLESLCNELQDTFTLCFIEHLASLGGLQWLGPRGQLASKVVVLCGRWPQFTTIRACLQVTS